MPKRNDIVTLGVRMSLSDSSPDPSGALRDAARERVLAAALACARRSGLLGLGVAAVAREAGVSRPTVYRYFRDRQELERQTVLRAAEEFADTLRARIESVDGAAERAVEAVRWTARQLPADAVLGGWARGSAPADFTGPQALALGRRALEPLVEAAGWSEGEAVEAIEVMLRVLLSLLLAPAPARSEARQRGFLERRLVPALGLRTRRRR
jgi:AcrR family transcriptional regulator